MKRKHIIICICSVTVLAVCAIGWTILAAKNDRVFVESEKRLTDGVIEYNPLPAGWYYRGRLLYRIGKVKDGNAIYALDEDGIFVQERKSWYEDVGRRQWMLSSYELPDFSKGGFHIMARRNGVVLLSEPTNEEFLTWYQAYLQEPIPLQALKHDYSQYLAQIYFHDDLIPNLEFDSQLELYLVDRTIYIIKYEMTSNGWLTIGAFGSDTALYQEMMEILQGNRKADYP